MIQEIRIIIKTEEEKSCNMKVGMIKKGFTLVELLVVIAIISILTVITVSQFQTAKRKANDVQRKADLSSLSKALQMYYTDYEKFPAAENGEIKVNATSMAFWGGTFDDAGYVYMKVMPKENKTGFPEFCYAVDANLKKFALYAMLENTADSDCTMTGNQGAYTCNGERYCFTIFSSNANKGEVQN